MERMNVLKARQIKAARALMDWSQEDLSSASGLSIATVRKLELGHISPRGKTTQHIRQALENAGLEFIEPDGVRHRPDDILVYQGYEDAQKFFDDVYHTIARKDGDLVAACPSEDEYSIQILGEYRKTHVERMTAIKDKISVKCILTDDKNALPAAAYCEYRWMSRHYVDSVPRKTCVSSNKKSD